MPFACSITDHKVSLLLKCVPNGKTFSYEADMANQRYSVRHMSTASETMWPSGKESVRQLVAGNTHDSMLIRDLNGAAFPSRGVPAIVAAACIRHRKFGWSRSGSDPTQKVAGSSIKCIIMSTRSGGVLLSNSGRKTVGAQRG